MVLSHVLSPILLIIYIKWRKLHLQTWGGWSFESLTEWWPFIRLGIPGFLTVAFEWWSFEINVLVSGSISQLQLAISVTILQLLTLYFMVSCYILMAGLQYYASVTLLQASYNVCVPRVQYLIMNYRPLLYVFLS